MVKVIKDANQEQFTKYLPLFELQDFHLYYTDIG